MSHILTVPLLILTSFASSPPGPTLAQEDTMFTELPEILVRAPRVTLDEILGRVARGEARRESLLTDQAFTATFRVVGSDKRKGAQKVVRETVTRVYKKKPDRLRTVMLRDRDERRGMKVGLEINFSPGMGEQIVNFAFRPESRREFKYQILDREVAGGRVIYEIGFAPRSTLDPWLPSGKVWVDTNEFVIVRQEAYFDRSPMPLFIRDMERMVIERQRVDAHWVLKRVLMRIATQFSFGQMGSSFDMSIQFDEYEINAGIDDAFFKEGR